MQVEFCTNNYYEMLAVIHVFMKGTVHVNYQDLFLEQQFVCPNLGFFEFLKKEYLDQILSWQYPSGCFGGCLAHKTGVAAGALVMYLRFLIDPGPLDFFSQHEFFPKDQSILGDPEANKKIMAFLGNQMVGDLDQQNHAALEDVFGGGQHGGGGEDENEDEEDEDAEYDDQDEMYPDRGGADGVPGDGLHQEKRVVHFGANDNIADDDNASDDYDNADEDEDEEYANEDEDEEDEEEGPDYIKRVKGDDNAAANADDDNNQNEDDTEYTYYDDNDNTEKGIIKKHKPQPPPQAGSVKGKVISVSYNGTCIDKKVMLKQKTYAGITIEFQSNEVTPTLKTVVHGVVAGLPVPFPVENPDACKGSNVTCPLQSGKTYTYSSVIYVSPSYPQITVVVKWELQDEDGKDEVCIALPAEITK
nr:hypothetical protein BaRGS_012296 [Batillaria attramentaria]